MSQDASVKIIRKISEAKRELGQKNIQGCLFQFKTALEIAISEKILPANKLPVQEEIEKLQKEIQDNKAFKDVYGPVTFANSEFDVALAFVKQLMQAAAEELFESTELSHMDEEHQVSFQREENIEDAEANQDVLYRNAMERIENGKLDEAKEIIAQNEALLDRIIDALNEKGISLRSSARYEEALAYYAKGLELRPDEEGLYYNMARAYFEKDDLAGALRCLEEALYINPRFEIAKALMNFIKTKPAPAGDEIGNSTPDSGASERVGKIGLLSRVSNLFSRKR
jgi:tetratricopeptide (TPR) repeat protein